MVKKFSYWHFLHLQQCFQRLSFFSRFKSYKEFKLIRQKCDKDNSVTFLTLSQTSPCFLLRICSKSLLKTLLEKEKLLVTINFSFSNSVFYPFGELSIIFIKFKIVLCKLFQFESFNFVVR